MAIIDISPDTTSARAAEITSVEVFISEEILEAGVWMGVVPAGAVVTGDVTDSSVVVSAFDSSKVQVSSLPSVLHGDSLRCHEAQGGLVSLKVERLNLHASTTGAALEVGIEVGRVEAAASSWEVVVPGAVISGGIGGPVVVIAVGMAIVDVGPLSTTTDAAEIFGIKVVVLVEWLGA
jgi:hypothetical protein